MGSYAQDKPCDLPCEIKADFGYNSKDECAIVFNAITETNECTQIIDLQWDFGDGNTGDGQSTTHQYDCGGTYTVCLTVIGVNWADTCEVKVCKEITVDCPDTCKLSNPFFTYQADDSCSIYFNGNVNTGPCTNIISWEWNFGDNQTATGQNVSHQYACSGTYPVCLTVTGTSGNDTCQVTYCDSIQVECNDTCELKRPRFKYRMNDSCVVDFKGSVTTGPCTNVTDWVWNFGDGNTGTGQQVSHRYTCSGTYVVCLTIYGTNATRKCKIQYCDTITVECDSKCVLKPDFMYTSAFNCTVSFTDMTTASPCTQPVSWYWSFGDGGTSTTQNPIHTYPGSGGYTACLTVTGQNGNQFCRRRVCKDIRVFCLTPIKEPVATKKQEISLPMDLEAFSNVYPNPTSGELTIAIELARKQAVKISIIETGSGQLINTIDAQQLEKGMHKIKWHPNADVPDGSYMIRIMSGNRSQNHNVMILRE